MLDPWATKLIKSPLNICAAMLKEKKIKPDQITLAGFFLGLMAFLFLFRSLSTKLFPPPSTPIPFNLFLTSFLFLSTTEAPFDFGTFFSLV